MSLFAQNDTRNIYVIGNSKYITVGCFVFFSTSCQDKHNKINKRVNEYMNRAKIMTG